MALKIFNKPILRLHVFGYVFTPYLLPTLGFIVLLPLLISLGMWQLDRADYKLKLLNDYRQRLNSLPLTYLPDEKEMQRIEFYPIRLKGRFDNKHQFLIDNRVKSLRVGFYVITPFIPDEHSEGVILVNRGWVARLATRQRLPKLDPIKGDVIIQGILRSPPQRNFVLQADNTKSEWPKLLQTIDLPLMSKLLRESIYPQIILLNKKSQYGYYRNWQPTAAISPHKHRAYAFQWFALAITLVIIYIIVNTKRCKDSDDNSKKKRR